MLARALATSGLMLVALSLFTGCSRSSREQDFWKWFASNQDVLFDFQTDQERIFDRLEHELHTVNPDLTFEFGPIENGKREFTISADGIRSAFPAVEALCAAAPPLAKWKILKFRQRHEATDLSYGGVYAKADQVSVALVPKAEKIDVTVYLPGYSPEKRKQFGALAFLFLDHALGEYDVETHVGEVDVLPASESPHNACSLAALPAAFDGRLSRH